MDNSAHEEALFLLGIAMAIIEFAVLPGIGLLFIGFGCLTTASLIYFYPEISNNIIATVGISSLAWFLLLWWPMKKLTKGSSQNEHLSFDLVGSLVTVIDEQVKTGQIGRVSWAGTIMNAKLKDSEHGHVKKGESLYVLAVEGNILVCSKAKSHN